MPLIGIETYKIDFNFLETNDSKILALIDQSNYLSTPEFPLLNVTLPGFTGYKEIAYTPGSIILLNSDDLGLTEPTEYEEYANLPDGVYTVTMKVCPYDELFVTKYYLKASDLECQYRHVLLGLDGGCTCMDALKIKETLIDVDILIQSAKAEAFIGNIDKATIKYRAASKRLERLSKQINCK